MTFPERRGVAWWIASGLGCGLSPVAPGTAGSLLGLVGALAVTAAFPDTPAGALLVVGGLVAFVGIPATALAARIGVHEAPEGEAGDPQWVVIDEVAGQLLACAGIPAHAGWLWYVAAFVAFRIQDIAKPGLIGWLDRQRGAVFVMADDALAGLATAVLLALAAL